MALAALGPFQTPSITFQFTFTDCHSSEKLVTKGNHGMFITLDDIDEVKFKGLVCKE